MTLPGQAGPWAAAFAAVDALLVPIAGAHPPLAEVAAHPVGVHSRMGAWTTYANLLDLCAAALPAGRAGEARFGTTVPGRAAGWRRRDGTGPP